MFCEVCGVGSECWVCPTCQVLTTFVDAVAPVPMQFKGTDRSNVRDRQWQFKHATELIDDSSATQEDLEQVRDRLPRSNRGTILRNQINKKLDDLLLRAIRDNMADNFKREKENAKTR